MQPFLAMITPLSSGGEPTHPIAPGGPPLGTWGGAGQPFPTPPIAPGGQPPYPSQGPGFPTHPIVIPPMQPPLGIWGGSNQPFPNPPIYIPIMPPEGENGETPEHPIYIPVYPSHPIYFPPGSSPEEIAKKLKELMDFATGNLPENPNERPEPVK